MVDYSIHFPGQQNTNCGLTLCEQGYCVICLMFVVTYLLLSIIRVVLNLTLLYAPQYIPVHKTDINIYVIQEHVTTCMY